MTDSWNDARPQSAWFNFKQIPISSDWFQVYEIATNLVYDNDSRQTCIGQIPFAQMIRG